VDLTSLSLEHRLSFRFLFAFALAVGLTPLFIRLAHAKGWVDRPAHRKIHKQPIAYMGGVGIMAAILLSVTLGYLIIPTSEPISQPNLYKLILLILPTLGMVVVGLVDDVRGISARSKLAAQFVFATAFALFGFNFEVFHVPGMKAFELGPLAIPVTVFFILAVVNAFNMVDGVDGLAGGAFAVTFFMIGAAGAILDSRVEIWIGVMALGAVLGFLVYNWHPGKIFLGDAGSNGLGMLAAMTVVTMGQTTPVLLGGDGLSTQPFHYHVFIALLLVGYPAVEIVTSILRRSLKGRPLWRADKGHIHHRLLSKGWHPRNVAIIGIVVSLFLSGASVAFLQDYRGIAMWFLIAFALLSGIGLTTLGYLDTFAPNAIAKSRPHYVIAHSFMNMQNAKIDLAKDRDELMNLVVQTCVEFGVESFRFIILPKVSSAKSSNPNSSLRIPNSAEGGCDCRWVRPARAQADLLDFMEPRGKAHGQFKDRIHLPNHKGEVGWVFDPVKDEGDLDVEYRVLLSEFMKKALEKGVELPEGGESFGPKELSNESPKVVPLSDLKNRVTKN